MNRKRYLPALVCLLATVCLLAIAMSTMTACGKSKKSSVVGTYHTTKAGDQLVRKADGTYNLVQSAATGLAGTFSGKWTLKGSKITIKLKNQSTVGKVLSNGTIRDDDGNIWTKR